jgi:uracil-DNA glycosylase
MTHKPLPAFASFCGPRSARTLLLGEAWGRNEAETRQPFVGESGKELFRLLGEANPELEPGLHAEICEHHRYGNGWVHQRERWFQAASIAMTNVLNFQPAANKLESISASKKEVGKAYAFPAITRSNYLLPEFLPELDRLAEEIAVVQPNLIVALGGTAIWALLQQTNIGSIRGNTTVATFLCGTRRQKVLPTYHPASLFRTWAWRPIVLADLMKASRQCLFPDLQRPRRAILINPTIEEVESWTEATIASKDQFRLLSPDIETGRGQLEMIGFARTRSDIMVIPFVDYKVPGGSYWTDHTHERRAWRCVIRLLQAGIALCGQNFIFDLQYLLPSGVFPDMNNSEDTMLLHHVLFPELKKSLGFLGSIYTEEASWKLMARKRGKKAAIDGEKKDE